MYREHTPFEEAIGMKVQQVGKVTSLLIRKNVSAPMNIVATVIGVWNIHNFNIYMYNFPDQLKWQ